jgi:hypothetical protein
MLLTRTQGKQGEEVRIEVRGWDDLLYQGEAEIRPTPGPAFEVEFLVPNVQVAQYQMRRGERVLVSAEDGAATPAVIQGFRFEPGASATGFGGQGRIQLVGSGAPPIGD